MSARVLNLQYHRAAFTPRIVKAPVSIGEFQIETGIPISAPMVYGRPKSELRQALEALRVGQSFQFRKSIPSGRAKAIAKQIGIQVACRTVSATHRRVWRTK